MHWTSIYFVFSVDKSSSNSKVGNGNTTVLCGKTAPCYYQVTETPLLNSPLSANKEIGWI